MEESAGCCLAAEELAAACSLLLLDTERVLDCHKSPVYLNPAVTLEHLASTKLEEAYAAKIVLVATAGIETEGEAAVVTVVVAVAAAAAAAAVELFGLVVVVVRVLAEIDPTFVEGVVDKADRK